MDPFLEPGMVYECTKYFIKCEKRNQAAIHYKDIWTWIYCMFLYPFYFLISYQMYFFLTYIFFPSLNRVFLSRSYIYSFPCISFHFIWNPLLTSKSNYSLFLLSLLPHTFLSGLRTVTVCHLRTCWSASTNENSLNLRTWVAGERVGAKLLLVNAGWQRMLAAW